MKTSAQFHFSEKSLRSAHSHDPTVINRSDMCGCFYCLKYIHPSAIVEWTADDEAICPLCGIDSIMGNYPSKAFLQAMRLFWFEE